MNQKFRWVVVKFESTEVNYYIYFYFIFIGVSNYEDFIFFVFI